MNTASRLIYYPVLLGLLWAGSACHRQEKPGQPASLAAAAVNTQVVKDAWRWATEEVVGTVRPKLSAVVAAKVSGTLERVLVSAGQEVKRGDWLAQMDAREIQARLDQAVAVREQTKNDIARFTKLLAQQAVTQQEFDAVQARQRVALATATEAETMLSYTRITAPFDGVITRKYADVGDLAVPGKPLFDIEDPRAFRLEADVPEADIGGLKMGGQLNVQVSPLTTNLVGTISEIAPAADPNSRTVLVKLDLPSFAGLRSGQFGRVAIPVAQVRALRVPAAAVVVRGQMEILFVAVNRQAQLRLVKTGKRVNDEVEIVSGLNPGETVVTEGASRLQDGQPLEVKL